MNQLLDGCPTSDEIRRLLRERRTVEPDDQVVRVCILDSAVSLYLWDMLSGLNLGIVIVEVGIERMSEQPRTMRLGGGFGSGSSSHEFPARELAEEMTGMGVLTDLPERGSGSRPSAVPLVLSDYDHDFDLMLRNDFSEIPLHHRLNWHATSPRRGQSAGERSRNKSKRR